MNGSMINEPKKVPLKLLMDPRGHVHGYEPLPVPAPMSPEFGIELVNALNTSKGKGEACFLANFLIFASNATPPSNCFKIQVLNYLLSVARRLKNGSSMEPVCNNVVALPRHPQLIPLF